MRSRPALLLAIFLPFLIIVLSFLPGHTKTLLHTKGENHLLGHFVIFMGVTFALCRAGSSYLRSAGLMSALAVGIELAQHVVYQGEHFEWIDVGSDLAGIAIASLFIVQRRHILQ